MKQLLIVLAACVLLASCKETKKEEPTQATEETEVAAAPAVNQLTDQQKAEGWKLLFNGTDTQGWKIYKDKPNNSWEVIDGLLYCKPFDSAAQRSDLMTVDKYKNFELAFEWKIAPQANSGVMYRVTEQFDEPYFSGPEYQVLDDKGWPGELKDAQLAGSNYDMHAAPKDKPLKAVGEWNTSRIVVNGNHVEHWLNETKVVEYELKSEAWTKLKNASKWKDSPGYGMAEEGHIDFQDHGGEVWYRNIMIKTL